MVHDAHNQHRFPVEAIEYPMPPMNKAANSFAEFGSGRANQRMASKQVKGFIKTEEIGVGDVTAKLFDRVLAYFQ